MLIWTWHRAQVVVDLSSEVLKIGTTMRSLISLKQLNQYHQITMRMKSMKIQCQQIEMNLTSRTIRIVFASHSIGWTFWLWLTLKRSFILFPIIIAWLTIWYYIIWWKRKIISRTISIWFHCNLDFKWLTINLSNCTVFIQSNWHLWGKSLIVIPHPVVFFTQVHLYSCCIYTLYDTIYEFVTSFAFIFTCYICNNT